MTDSPSKAFQAIAQQFDVAPVTRRVLSDHLTPVLAYRRLVAGDGRTDTSFLLESVEVGGTVGRHSILAARPIMEVTARRREVTVVDSRKGSKETNRSDDPLATIAELTDTLSFAPGPDRVFRGGWAGWLGYDSVRWIEPDAVPESGAPTDDRQLPDMHFGLFDTVIVFDHVDKTLSVTCWQETRGRAAAEAWEDAQRRIDDVLELLSEDSVTLPAGRAELTAEQTGGLPGIPLTSQSEFEASVSKCIEYIKAGDIFQVVPSQRFERTSDADPFDVYRALRVVNPSPYMMNI